MEMQELPNGWGYHPDSDMYTNEMSMLQYDSKSRTCPKCDATINHLKPHYDGEGELQYTQGQCHNCKANLKIFND